VTTKQTSTYGTTITSTYVGIRERDEREGETSWRHHLWRHHLWDVTLTREGQSITFPYRMGTAHEQTKCGRPKPSTTRYRPTPETVCGHMRCVSAGWQPVPPTLYDVLTSLKADCVNGQTFADWCSDFGMDVDSIKARELYFACQESENRSQRFFGADWSAILDDDDYV
jgi:hypothetical protein